MGKVIRLIFFLFVIATNGINSYVFSQDKLQWAYLFEPNQSMYPVDNFEVDKSNNLYISYWYNYQTEVDPDDPSVTINNGTTTQIHPHLRKYDTNGKILFSFPTMGGVTSHHITVDASNNLIISGYFNGIRDFDHGPGTYNMTSTGAGGADYFIAKYNQNGGFLWAKQWQFNSTVGSYLTRLSDVKTDASGNIYITGGFRATEDFDPGPGTANLTPVGTDDIFIAKYDPSGNYIFAFNIGNTGWDGGQEIAVTSTQEIVVAGQYESTVDFDPGVGVYNLSGGGAFIAKYTSVGAFSWANDIGTASFNDLEIDASDNVYLSTNNTNIKKYNNSGSLAWAFSISNTTGGSRLKIDPISNHVVISGRNSSGMGSVDVNPGAGVYSLLGGCYRNFFARYNFSGVFVSAFEYSKNDVELEVGGFGIDNSGNIMTGGVVSSSNEYVNFVSPGSTVSTYFRFKTPGKQAAYIAKYGYNTPPIIAESDLPLGCYLQNRVLTASGTLGAPYYWTFNRCGGAPVPSNGLPYTSITVGNPTNTLDYWVRSGSLCARVSIGNVNGPATNPSFASASPTSIPCTGGSVTLTTSSPSEPTCSPYPSPNVVWYSGSCGGTYIGTGTSIVVSPSVTTTYYAAFERCGMVSSCRSVTVTVVSPPSAPIVGAITQPTCAIPTGSVALSGLPASGSWTLTRTPGGTTYTGTGTTYTVTGLPAGATYTFTVTNSSGCTSSASANVVINAIPPNPSAPVIGAITQPTCAISTGSVALSGLPASGSWTLTRTPGGTTYTGTGTTYTVTGLPAGATYTFTVTNSSGCTSSASANVVINAIPPNPSAPIVGSITQPTCTTPTGSVDLSGLPASGSWTLTRTPGGTTYTGTGTTYTVTGLPAGVTYTFTVTNSSGCTSSASANVVINVAPLIPSAPIVGSITQPTCTTPTGSVALSGLPASGSWTLTRTPGGTTYTGTGTTYTVTGLPASATYTFTVTNSSGCTSSSSANVVINAVPPNPTLGGATEVCVGSTANVSPSSGGTWSSSNTAVATVDNTGLVTGISAGSVTLTFTETSTGCSNTKILTVNALPSVSITGSSNICVGGTTQLSPSTGGTWASSNTSVATVDNTGLVTGVGAGSATFIFTSTSTGCSSSSTPSVTVNSNPLVSITGTGTICIGSTTQLSPSTGGTWVSSNTSVATVDNTGLVTGVGAGSATFTFTQTSTGCSSNPTPAITVLANPVASITGSSSICIGGTSQLSPTSGGTWTSSNTAVATATNGGVLTGLSAGSVTFTFTSTAGCVSNATSPITVNPNNTVSAAGSATLCQDSLVNITHSTTGATGIGAASGLPAGVTASFSSGTITISGNPTSSGIFNYSIPLTGGCGLVNATGTITVNPTPSVSITGADSICVGLTTQLSPSTGGTWSSSNTLVATVDNTGLVTGVGVGTAAFTFTSSSTGCSSNPSAWVIVNETPSAPILGSITQPICTTPTGSVALSGLPSTGSWTITASPGGLQITGSGTSATFTGLPENTTYTFTVTTSQGCNSSPSDSAVINPIPGAPVLGGADSVCIGATASVSPTSGGTWSSSNTAVATVDNTGLVTGISPGVVTLTFIDGTTGCSNSLIFTVNGLPVVSISGSDSICLGQQTQLSPSAGGTWISHDTAVATVDNTGLVTGVSVGTATFTFTLTSTGCSSNPSDTVTVLAIPAAPGGVDQDTICIGQSISISANTALGMSVNWYTNAAGSGTPVSSSNPFTVSPTSTTTYYAFSNNGFCNSDSSLAITVYVLFPPASPWGDTQDTICIGDTASLFVNLPTTGSYVEWYDNGAGIGSPISNDNPLLVSPDTTTTYYAFATNGYCYSDGGLAVTVYVLPIPTVPSGVDSISICLGDSVALSASAGGLGVNWYNQIPGSVLSTNNPWVIYPTSDTIFYSYAHNGYCQSNDSLQVNVYVLPVPSNPLGSLTDSICLGDSLLLEVLLDSGAVAQWYDTSGVLVSSQNPWVIYPTHDTLLYVYAYNGVCYSHDSLLVDISVFTVPSAPLIPDTYFVCLGDTVALEVENAAGLQVDWYNNQDSVVSHQNPWILVPDQDTSFYVLLSNGVCMSHDTETVVVQVHSNPILSLIDAQPLCFDSLGSIDADVQSGTAPYSYQWSNGSLDSLLNELDSGTYILTVTDAMGCYIVDTAHIAAPLPMNPSIEGLDSLCDNVATWYFVQGAGILTYQWSTGQTTDSVLYSVPNTENPYLMVTVSNANGCIEVDSILIHGLVSPEVSILFDDSICDYQNFVFTAQTSNQNAILWFNNQTSSSITLENDPMPDTVWVTVSNAHGCMDTAYVYPQESIFVIQSPMAGFDTSYHEEFISLVSFIDSSSSDVVSWAWDFGDGGNSTLENPRHDFASTGTFTTQLVVANSYGCLDTTSVEIIIGDHLFIPNVFSPNADGYNDLFVIPTVGIKNPYLVIKNRWGATLYETEGRNLYWDGRTNAGSPVSEGTYYYILYSKGSEQTIQTGFVTLLRD